MTKRPVNWEDKTPTEAVRLKSGTALSLLDMATSTARLARAYDHAEKHVDPDNTRDIGAELITLGRDIAALGYAIVRARRKR